MRIEPTDASLSSTAPSVTILMCTFNGARYLPDQLASFAEQTHTNWRLVVSDDGSTDETLQLIEAFAKTVSQPVEIRSGPKAGSTANFLTLAADPSVGGDYFAFADQDDVWHPSKITHALAVLATRNEDGPAVYGGRSRFIDASGTVTGYSRIFRRPPGFANALVQSIAGGNTMLFNSAAKRLIEAAGVRQVTTHDWWLYQLVTGSGGVLHYDPDAFIDYRQHEQNIYGGNRSLSARLKRLSFLTSRQYAAWNRQNSAALSACAHLLTPDARAQLKSFDEMRSPSLMTRAHAFLFSDIRRQSPIGNIGLFAATICGFI
ncbi:MAG: glycosyltransferase family 2 protein [Hyphomicrobium sp.]|jgi:glycosyltransferase involved in cell wall biosynthesis